jgi:hypothetical protein
LSDAAGYSILCYTSSAIGGSRMLQDFSYRLMMLSRVFLIKVCFHDLCFASQEVHIRALYALLQYKLFVMCCSR